MEEFPARPDAADAPDLFDGGHLWIQERVTGRLLRFQVEADGRLRFGDDRRTFEADGAPRPLRHAVHHVQRILDRAALQSAVADSETVTFFGVATRYEGVDHDWDRLPSMLVGDVHDADAGQFLPPARVEQVAERLGLAPANALEKEVRAVDFDPASYEFPESAWRDGPVAGVVVRNKTGQRATLENSDVRSDEVGSDEAKSNDDASAADVAAEYATAARYQRVADELEQAGWSVTFDAVQERVLDGVYREHAPAFFDGRPPADFGAFKQEVARRTSEFLADR